MTRPHTPTRVSRARGALLGLSAGVAPQSTAEAIEDLRTLNVSLTGIPAGTS